MQLIPGRFCHAVGLVLTGSLLAALVTGCGHPLYAARAGAASSKLEEAREAGAEQRAPYEFTLADEHLKKAMSEASEADYGDAFDLATEAQEHAQRALALSKGETVEDAPASSADEDKPAPVKVRAKRNLEDPFDDGEPRKGSSKAEDD